MVAYSFPLHYATLKGHAKPGVSEEEHLAFFRKFAERTKGVYEIPNEVKDKPAVESKQKAKGTRIMMDDGSYRYITDDQLREMLRVSDEESPGIDKEIPLVAGGAELKARRKENGLSLRQASELLEVSVATISRWENLGELRGRSLLGFNKLAEMEEVTA